MITASMPMSGCDFSSMTITPKIAEGDQHAGETRRAPALG